MIDTKELRRLAQAATPGPWYVTGKLTRYVEARIDGGLIQEVAACGPTKADGGYGPQQEANARLIAAANPAAINELLDRLVVAETAAIEQARLNGMGGEREAALMAKLEASESIKASYKNAFEISENTIRNLTEKVIPNIRKKLEAAEKERDELRAKIEEMEKQEPYAFAVAFPETSRVELVHDLDDLYEDLTYEAHDVRKLYLTPGAKGEGK